MDVSDLTKNPATMKRKPHPNEREISKVTGSTYLNFPSLIGYGRFWKLNAQS
jgi:hypothetical protein